MTPFMPDLKALFLEAIERFEGPERADFLNRACRGDASLRAQVEELLEAHDRVGGDVASASVAAAAAALGAREGSTLTGEGNSADAVDTTAPRTLTGGGTGEFFPESALHGHTTPRPTAEGSGMRIGPYRLREKLGEGGMGSVFLAEQEHPVHRKVALKVIKPGMDTEQIVARFEGERQALALMDHPNIARVYDAGAADSGRPYFVMELVAGVPITQYCDRARLATRQRLELFVTVCQAIQHAHQKGVIHRDIKPSNVLVTVQDGHAVPKVIDFGVAKAIEQRLTDRTLSTQLGVLVGTPEYMSPEQADLTGGGIDTRSDIYLLGILLYELLTGTTPLGRIRPEKTAFSEVLRRIREEEPPSPSTRLSDSGEALAAIAACRNIEPARLAQMVRGDLDWIAMKALEKDRSRRYATAVELARDIQRHLDGDPVEASPPSLRYRLGKFARKHRRAFATAAVFVMMLVVASLFSTWLMLRARVAERLAERRLDELGHSHDDTMTALSETEKARAQARSEADKAEAINNFLINDLLTQAEPAHSAAEDHVELLNVLDRAAEKVGTRFAGQPEVDAALRRTIAATYHGLASWDKAERQWRSVLESARRHSGPESAEAFLATSELAHILVHRGRSDAEVIAMARSATDGLTRVLGPDHPDTLTSRSYLGKACFAAGRTTEAIQQFESGLKLREARLGPDHPNTLTERINLASAYSAAGRIAEAIVLFELTRKLMDRALGPEHPNTLLNRNQLAANYQKAGRLAEAIALHEFTLALQESRLGPNHPSTFTSRSNLANVYQSVGRVADAIALHETTLKLRESRLGRDHPATLASRNNLAAAYLAAGRVAEAIALHEANLKLVESRLGREHRHTLFSRSNLAAAYHDAGRVAEAIELHEPTLKLRESQLGPDHPDTLTSRNNLATAYLDAGRVTEAVALHEANLKLAESKLGPSHPATLQFRHNLANAYLDAGRVPRAVAMHEATLEPRQEKLGLTHPDTLSSMDNLVRAYLASKQWGEAEKLARQCLAVREKAHPDHWTSFLTRSQLGGALLGQKRFAKAEPLVVAGYRGMKAQEAKIPRLIRPRLPEAARRVVELYEAWGKSAKAAEWKARIGLAELPANVFSQ